MPEPAPGPMTETQRFDALWEEVGAKRVVLGDEEDGVTIRVDADLSIFAILDKIKEAAKSERQTGDISKDEEKSVIEALDQTVSRLSDGLHDKLTKHFERFKRKSP